jgi:5-methyltetrahydropteroyltriglutamate--homocysteine methyltransferase
MPSCPVCRADHIGSLLRPQRLRDAHRAYRAESAGPAERAGYESTLDASITDAVRMQEEAGLGVVTDGEFRRRSWFAGFVDAVEGLEHRDTEFNFMEDGDATLNVPVPHARAKIQRRSGIAIDEFTFAQSVATKPVKVTLPSPSVIHFFRGPEGIDRDVYPDDDEYWQDLIAVYREEIAVLAEAGCTYVQLDEVPIALLCDENIQRRVKKWDWEWRKLLHKYLWASNEIMKDRPEGMTFGVHLCRGNFRGHWIGSGGYEPVAERLFTASLADQFLLEFDSERAGDFRPLRFLPETKSAVLGLVSSKNALLERTDDIASRISSASKFVPIERLAVSPQCGFGTTVGGAPMTEAEQRAKLELVGRVAREVWR